MFENYLYDKKIIKEWKAKGGKILGYFCSNVPEEIIYAAEVLPIRIFGETQHVEKAYNHLPSWVCFYSKRCLETGLEGKYDFLDGIVGIKSDDTNIMLSQIWGRTLKPNFFYFLQFPCLKEKLNIDFYLNNLQEFKTALENFTGNKISDEKLKESIKIYNQNRKLLKKLYMLRKQENPPINGAETLKIVLASMTMPKEKHNILLQKFLESLQEKSKSYGGVRLHITGTVLYDVDVLNMVEECGAIVVSDDLCTGSRYFWSETRENGNPMEAIVQRYIYGKVTCMELTNQLACCIDERVEYINRMVKEFKAEGVLYLGEKGCEICTYAKPRIQQMLKELAVPFLYLDLDFPLAKAPYQTRIEAFIESLGRR